MFLQGHHCRLFQQRIEGNPAGIASLHDGTVNYTLLFRITHFHYISVFDSRILNDNEIVRIKADGMFRDLPNLLKVDLRRNQISSIENGAFEGASTLVDL